MTEDVRFAEEVVAWASSPIGPSKVPELEVRTHDRAAGGQLYDVCIRTERALIVVGGRLTSGQLQAVEAATREALVRRAPWLARAVQRAEADQERRAREREIRRQARRRERDQWAAASWRAQREAGR